MDKQVEQEQRHVFDKPENVRHLLRILYLACALLLVLDLVIHRHAIHAWESLRGFYGFYGFLGCIALVLIAKHLRRILKRPEDFYDI